MFQSSLPMLPSLKSEVKRLLRIILGRFIKPNTIKDAGDDFDQIDLNSAAIQLPNKEVGIGHKTSEEEDHFDSTTKRIFFQLS